jgi:SpoVK/Ycf46/Vps4 family AAA+-type ATPase
MGETTAKLRQVFELVGRSPGVYLFDEFDSIGGGRTNENDVGEMRRVLTALLQFIELDRSDSIIVAATNSPELLDRALFRRFDDVLSYENPDVEGRRRLIANALGVFIGKRFAWEGVLRESEGLSSADVVQACRDALKEAVLADRHSIGAADVKRSLKERRHRHGI